MALECRIVASATAPVQEVITEGETGRLFPFFDAALVARVRETLEAPEARPPWPGRRGGAAQDPMISKADACPDGGSSSACPIEGLKPQGSTFARCGERCSGSKFGPKLDVAIAAPRRMR